MTKETVKYTPPDGVFNRTLKQEYRINEAAKLCFAGEVGDMFLNYLVSITLNYVNGPKVDTNSLLHLEGQRYLVSVIKNRIRHGELKLPVIPDDEGKS